MHAQGAAGNRKTPAALSGGRGSPDISTSRAGAQASKRHDELEPELVALEAVLGLGLMVPLAYEMNPLLVGVGHARADGEDLALATVGPRPQCGRDRLSIKLVIGRLLQVITRQADAPGSKALADEVIHVELVTGLVLAVLAEDTESLFLDLMLYMNLADASQP